MIIAPAEVVATWRREAGRAVQAARTPHDPAVLAGLADAPPALGEWISHLTETLSHLGGTLLASAVQAVPGAPQMFYDGLTRLANEVARQQAEDLDAQARGEPGYVCPLPQIDGQPFRCGCPAGVRCHPSMGFAAGLRPDLVGDGDGEPCGDDGCEGGVA
jgi:hypothetical protein